MLQTSRAFSSKTECVEFICDSQTFLSTLQYSTRQINISLLPIQSEKSSSPTFFNPSPPIVFHRPSAALTFVAIFALFRRSFERARSSSSLLPVSSEPSRDGVAVPHPPLPLSLVNPFIYLFMCHGNWMGRRRGGGRAGEAYTGACIEPGFPWDRQGWGRSQKSRRTRVEYSA